MSILGALIIIGILGLVAAANLSDRPGNAP